MNYKSLIYYDYYITLNINHTHPHPIPTLSRDLFIGLIFKIKVLPKYKRKPSWLRLLCWSLAWQQLTKCCSAVTKLSSARVLMVDTDLTQHKEFQLW